MSGVLSYVVQRTTVALSGTTLRRRRHLIHFTRTTSTPRRRCRRYSLTGRYIDNAAQNAFISAPCFLSSISTLQTSEISATTPNKYPQTDHERHILSLTHQYFFSFSSSASSPHHHLQQCPDLFRGRVRPSSRCTCTLNCLPARITSVTCPRDSEILRRRLV